MRLKYCGIATICLALPCAADYSYQETSKVTGGSMLRLMSMVPGGKKATEPQVSTVYLKGNKLARVSPNGINIIDIDAETITDVNLEKKQYAVITFAEMAQALAAMKAKAEQELAKNKNANAQMNFDIDVKSTGQSKVVEGYMAKEMLMTLSMAAKDPQSGQSGAMAMETSLWQTDEIKNDEMRNFYLKMAQKVNWAPAGQSLGSAMMGMGEGMNKLAAEVKKLEGTTLMQVTNMIMLGPDGKPIQTAEGADAPPPPTSGEIAQGATDAAAASAASRALGGRMGGLAAGGLGGFGRKKSAPKQEQAPPPADNAAPGPAGKPASFMEMTITMSNFSTGAVDGSKLVVPAGFKEVEHDMKKTLREVSR